MANGIVSVGIVGGGRVGLGFAKFIQSLKDEARLTGVVTSTPARQKELSTLLKVPCFGTTEELMNSGDKPDVVAVVNANEDHYEATLAALQLGAHVFCEKPMAPTLEECRKMVAAEKASGKTLQIGFEYMHGTMTSRLRQLINEDYFGELLSGSVLDSRGHWASDAPSKPISENWKLDRQRGGGIVFHCGIHQLDMIRCYFGKIESVTAFRAPKNALSFYPYEIPDNVTLMIKAASGAVINFQIFHNRAPCYYRETNPWQPDWRTIPGHEFDFSIVGTKASCHMQIYKEKLSLFKYNIPQRDTTLDRVEDFGFHPANASHHDMSGFLLQYLRSVAAGTGAIDAAADALETMKIAFAAEDSIATGRTHMVREYD